MTCLGSEQVIQMQSFSFRYGTKLRIEVDTFGVYVVAGGREFFWQAGLGLRNLTLCSAPDRAMVVIGA